MNSQEELISEINSLVEDDLNKRKRSIEEGEAMDKVLFKILKDLRKKLAKKIGLPPAILFMEPSLIDMANKKPNITRRVIKRLKLINYCF